jgi:hypothetical protein
VLIDCQTRLDAGDFWNMKSSGLTPCAWPMASQNPDVFRSGALRMKLARTRAAAIDSAGAVHIKM